MIIQCRQCRTKFRFDDSLMQGNGVWLRCSRCGHVYFQENPLAKNPPQEVVLEIKSEAADQEAAAVEMPSPEEAPSVFYPDKQGAQSLDRIMEARRRIKEEISLDTTPSVERQVEPGEPQAEETPEENAVTGIEEIKKPAKKRKSASRKSGGIWKLALWSILVIFVIPALIYFYVFPDYGAQLIGAGQYLIERIDALRGVAPPVTSGAHINQMIKLQDVRYRRVNNYILGQIAVVEGFALNTAEYPVARIMIKGEILDAYAVVLGERTSYAGNILTDEELANFSEEEILMKLLRPEGTSNSNDRVMPNARIPFMIVFPNEPSGVIKTTVVTVGAERILE
ncbi:MAG TPA: zinc-ribbon domain-containing protein [Smithella sp.]|nr:zinc-ribbon domain-containing protein [Smithella sp.]